MCSVYLSIGLNRHHFNLYVLVLRVKMLLSADCIMGTLSTFVTVVWLSSYSAVSVVSIDSYLYYFVISFIYNPVLRVSGIYLGVVIELLVSAHFFRFIHIYIYFSLWMYFFYSSPSIYNIHHKCLCLEIICCMKLWAHVHSGPLSLIWMVCEVISYHFQLLYLL